MLIGSKSRNFYPITAPAFQKLGEFSMTEQQLKEYEQVLKLNPFWGKQLSDPQYRHQPIQLKSTTPTMPTLQTHLVQQQLNAFSNKIKQIEYSYQEHNIDGAFKALQELKVSAPNKYSENHGYERLFHQIERQYHDMIQSFKPIIQPGWQLKQQHNGVRMSIKNISQQLCVLIESGVNVPAEIFLQAMVQLDYFNKIIPMVQFSEEVKTLARNIKIGHFVVDIPILASREAFYQGMGYDRLGTNGTIYLYIRSIHNQPNLLQELNFQPKFRPKTQPLNFKFIDLEYTPKTLNSGVCKLCLNVSLDMKMLPNWILSKVLRTFSFKIFDNIVKVSQNFKGSIWQKRAIENPMLFNFFRQRAKQYFEAH